MQKTHNPSFLTLFIIPQHMLGDGTAAGLTSTPSLRIQVEGSSILGIRADQIIVSRGCDFNSNTFKTWFLDLGLCLVPGGRLIVV